MNASAGGQDKPQTFHQKLPATAQVNGTTVMNSQTQMLASALEGFRGISNASYHITHD